MTIALALCALELRPGRAVTLTTAAGDSIHVVDGLVWATTSGHPGDLWLRAGHRHMLERQGTTVIEAPHGARIELVPARATSLLRALMRRWRPARAAAVHPTP